MAVHGAGNHLFLQTKFSVNLWGYVDNFVVDRFASGYYQSQIVDIGSSRDPIRVLAGAAAHLASALDVLSNHGCDWFLADLAEMLEVIDGQIATLEALANGDSSSSVGV